MPTTNSSWKTTLAGVLGITTAALAIYSHPASITDPAIIAGLATSIGLIAAQDNRPNAQAVDLDTDEQAAIDAYRRARAAAKRSNQQ